jgi:amidase
MSNYMSTTSNTTPSALQLRHATLQDIVESLERGVFTTKQLVRAYITRISEVNHEYRAVIETNPDATEDARLLDLERCLRGSRGKLHGIPILLKDNISTIDNTDTTCGSMALIGAKSAREATIVTALRSSGAIVLGKANMAEWSGFRSTSGCSGWSARGGQTTGVFYPNTKASGSSSGSAVAVALGLCFAALGTEVC